MTLIVLGAFILLTQIGISWLSHSFVFGAGHAERPILSFLMLEGLAFIAYFATFEWLRRNSKETHSKSFLSLWIFVIAILCRVAYLPSNPIQETDPYRYLWDGETLLRGENPYALSPKEAFQTGEERGEISSPDMGAVFERINHPGIKTIYPPFAQILFALSQWITPWKLWGWKAMILVAELGILSLTVAILKRFDISKEWSLLYAWSPLVLKEFSNSLHLDVFVILFLTGMIYCLTRDWLVSAYGLLSLAALTKWFPVVLFPLLIAWTLPKQRRQTFLGVGLFLVLLVLFYLPFSGVGVSLFEGLGIFATSWRVNDGLFSLIHGSVSMLPVNNEWTHAMSRIIAGGIFSTAIVLVLHWLKRKEDLLSFCQASLVVLTFLFLLAPTGNPWYLTWIFPFLFFIPLRSLILLSGLIFLYYLDFYFTYQGKPHFFDLSRLVEYGIFYFFLGWELWTKNQQFPLLFRLRTKEPLLLGR
ncbi:MAG: hypothetical protein HY447_01265 [Candidatus Omnitrophica bacterium]|nr:hypothetical protein [Candidatus Omnitrophota bacterium]